MSPAGPSLGLSLAEGGMPGGALGDKGSRLVLPLQVIPHRKRANRITLLQSICSHRRDC